jgi:hypothetical protein
MRGHENVAKRPLFRADGVVKDDANPNSETFW